VEPAIVILSWLTLAIWVYLVFARGFFWRISGQNVSPAPAPTSWPKVVAIIPARNEALTIGASIRSLLRQDYPGAFGIIVVDDASSDATAAVVRSTAKELAAGHRLKIIRGTPLQPGWAGKVWAQQQGFEALAASRLQPDYVLLTDADIVHKPGALQGLVRLAIANDLALASVMARLHCRSFAERFAIPAFVYFFRMLYPFAWVADRSRHAAAAAGGCMLVKFRELQAAGGFRPISGAIIDDCALARVMKDRGPIWLGLSDEVESIRAQEGFGPIRQMVMRSAYAELDHAPSKLALAVLGMCLTFLAPPLLALFAPWPAAAPAAVAWLLMALSFVPMLRFYRLNLPWALALPLIAAVYTFWTLLSALAHARGTGGMWKGRPAPMREAAS
jgi:hopene-associated glycosyltransferase HpnB